MILLGSSAVLKVSLGGTVGLNQLVFTAHYVDLNGTSFVPGENDGLTNNATQVTMISSPSAGLTRQTKYISIYNADTVTDTVNIVFNNGTDRTILSIALKTGYSLTYNIESGWTVTDTNGSIQFVGNAGSNGANAFTTTTANFTQPASGSTVSVSVATTAWMASGQILYVQDGSADGGYYSVNSISSGTVVVLKNLGYPGNSAASTTILSAAAVVPGGLQGAAGVAGATGATGPAGTSDYLYITNN